MARLPGMMESLKHDVDAAVKAKQKPGSKTGG